MQDKNFRLSKKFLKTWHVTYWVALAYYFRSNGRAEAAVRHAKRLLRYNVTESGNLDRDIFLSAMLRNIPDSNCKVSPAEIIYGQQLQDGFAF